MGGREALPDGLAPHAKLPRVLPVRPSGGSERGDARRSAGSQRVDSSALRPSRPGAGDQQLGLGSLGEWRGVTADREIERPAQRLAARSTPKAPIPRTSSPRSAHPHAHDAGQRRTASPSDRDMSGSAPALPLRPAKAGVIRSAQRSPAGRPKHSSRRRCRDACLCTGAGARLISEDCRSRTCTCTDAYRADAGSARYASREPADAGRTVKTARPAIDGLDTSGRFTPKSRGDRGLPRAKRAP